MMKRLSAWTGRVHALFWSWWNRPMSPGALAVHMHENALLVNEDQEQHSSSQEWLVAGVHVLLVWDDAPVMPYAYIEFDAGDWQHTINVEVDAGFEAMLWEACHYLAELPSN